MIKHVVRGHLRFTAAGLAVALAGGCTTYPKLSVKPLPAPERAARAAAPTEDSSTRIKLLSPAARAAAGEQHATTPVVQATAEQIAVLVPDRPVSAAFPPQPLPQFIETVFGQILQVPYFTGPGVARRRDIVSLNGAVTMSSRTFFALVQTALRQYGVAVAIENGTVKIVDDELLANAAPLYMRARTMPDAPVSSRPVLRFANLTTIGAGSLSDLLGQVYPDQGAVRFVPQEDENALVISGNQREVAAAAALAQKFDEPDFAGAQVARIEPVFWSAEGLAEAVRAVMANEGVSVSIGAGGGGGGANFLPVPFANSILLFAHDRETFKRVLYWVRELDSPGAFNDQEGVFVYTVQNTTAPELGALVSQLLPGADTASAPSRVTPLSGERSTISNTSGGGLGDTSTAGQSRLRPREGDDAAGGRAPTTTGRLTIDPGGNRLIFRGKRSEFATLRGLLVDLDTPPRQVLVEITVAEVTLTDETRFGIEWFLNAAVAGGTFAGNTAGGLVKEPGGLGATFSRAFSRGTVQAALNAIATNRNLNVLSTPRLVARSGSEAQILVGSDVPIITSQRAANNQTNGDTDILQTVQYRQTGVILTMRPVVYGTDRVDIELFQEVSTQQPNNTAAIASPVILNRSVTTQLSLREGMTAVIGGMMQDGYTREQRGVPLLKDIPILGQLFRVDAVTGQKVELVLLITPYIIRSDDQMGEASASYAGSINRLLKDRGPQVYTLLPWRNPFGATRRVHGLPPIKP